MYFNKFPIINYRNLGKHDKDQTRRVARDIVRRVAFSSRLKDEGAMYADYLIKESERPEHIAEKIYGKPEYHWVVLLFNDIINPYYEWPLADSAIENYIKKKYPGDVLYCSNISVSGSGYTSNPNQLSGITFAANDTVFQWSGTRDDYGKPIVDHTTKALVWKHDREKQSLEIINEHGNFVEGNYILKVLDNEVFQYAYIEKKTENIHGLHHFETEGVTAGEEVWLNSLASTEGIPMGQTGAGPTNGSKTVGGTGSGANIASPVVYTDTLIAKYMGVGGGNDGTLNNSIANDVYEYRTNDRKRKIKLLDPQYLDLVLKEFDTLMSSGDGRTIFNTPRGKTKQTRSY